MESTQKSSFRAVASQVISGEPGLNRSNFLLCYRLYVTPTELFQIWTELLNLEKGTQKESEIMAFLYEWLETWFTLDFHKKPCYSELLSVIDTLNGKHSQNLKLLLVKNTKMKQQQRKEDIISSSDSDFKEDSQVLKKNNATTKSFGALPAVPSPGTPNKKVNAINGSRSVSSPELQNIDKIGSVLDLSSSAAARVFTLHEFELFQKILPTELLSLGWQKEDRHKTAPNITKLTDRFNQVSQWVTTEILIASTKKQQRIVLEKFIKIAKKCILLNNFNTSMALLSGMCVASVQRLHYLWDSISDKCRQAFCEIEELLSPHYNYKHYRTEAKSRTPPLLPQVAVYLKDITFTIVGNENYTTAGAVNIELMNLLGSIIDEVRLFQSKPYKLQTDPATEEYLVERNLRSFDEDTLYKRSLRLQPSLWASNGSGGSGKGSLRASAASSANHSLAEDDIERDQIFPDDNTEVTEDDGLDSMSVASNFSEGSVTSSYHTDVSSIGSSIHSENGFPNVSRTILGVNEALQRLQLRDNSGGERETNTEEISEISSPNTSPSRLIPTTDTSQVTSPGELSSTSEPSTPTKGLSKSTTVRSNLLRVGQAKNLPQIQSCTAIQVPQFLLPIFSQAQSQVDQYFGKCIPLPQKGIIEIVNERYFLVRASALSYDLVNFFSNLQAKFDRVMIHDIQYDIGFSLGQADAKNFQDNQNLKNSLDLWSACFVFNSFTGFFFANIAQCVLSAKDIEFYVCFNSTTTFESSAFLSRHSGRPRSRSNTLGEDSTSENENTVPTLETEPVCHTVCGYISGWCSKATGLPLTCVEVTCRSRGDSACTFLVGHYHRIDFAIHNYMDEHKFSPKQMKDIRVHTYEKGILQYKNVMNAHENQFVKKQVYDPNNRKPTQEMKRVSSFDFNLTSAGLRTVYWKASGVFSRLKCDPASAQVSFNGEKYIFVRTRSLCYQMMFENAILLEGTTEPEKFLFDLGYALGSSDQQSFCSKLIADESAAAALIQKIQGLAATLTHTGWGKTEVAFESTQSSMFSISKSCVYFEFTIQSSAEAHIWCENASNGMKAQREPVCCMSCGYASGWLTATLGTSVAVVEVECQALGGTCCHFIVSTPSHTKEHIAAYINRQPTAQGNSYHPQKHLEATLRISRALVLRAMLLSSHPPSK